MKTIIGLIIGCSVVFAQTPATPPTYFANTGVRYNYYDKVLTETTNFGIRVTQNSSNPVTNTPSNSFWSITSVDATPRSKEGSAALRESVGYFLKSTGNVTFFSHAGVGVQTNSNASTTTNAVGSLLGTMDGGLGVVWNVCKTLKSAFNCSMTVDYSILSVTSQSVKPVVGFYLGTSF